MADYKHWLEYKKRKTKEKKINRSLTVLKIIYIAVIIFAITYIISIEKKYFINLLIDKFPNIFTIDQNLIYYGWWLDLSLAVTIILFIYNIYITKKIRINETINNRRDFKGLLEPALAETIIDRSLNLKKVIMSIIMQLKLKGNIEIIDDESIALINEYDLENYEQKLIKLFFKEKKIISFKEINNFFNVKKFKETVKIILDIKKDILLQLRDRKLFDDEYMENKSIIKGISYLIIVNLPIIFAIIAIINPMIYPILPYTLTLMYIYCMYNCYLFYYIIKAVQTNSKILELYIVNSSFWYNIRLKILPSILNIIGFINYYNINKLLAIQYTLVLLLNILLMKKKNTVILSDKGHEEQIKLLELKKYIEDYSLLDDKNLTAANIWNEYLAYAVAFGIPNNIINKIYEHLYNLNVVVQSFK